jgi:hypothetical protein
VRLAQLAEVPAAVKSMRFYGPRAGTALARGYSRTRTASRDPAARGDGDDLEVSEVLPAGDPRVRQRDVVALHHLGAAT